MCIRILCVLQTVRGGRLPIFRRSPAGHRVQRTRLQWIRFAGRRHVCGQTRRVHFPGHTGCRSSATEQASDFNAAKVQKKIKIVLDRNETTVPLDQLNVDFRTQF